MIPDLVASLDAHSGGQTVPQVGCLTHLGGSEVNAGGLLQRLFSTFGGAATTPGFIQLCGTR